MRARSPPPRRSPSRSRRFSWERTTRGESRMIVAATATAATAATTRTVRGMVRGMVRFIWRCLSRGRSPTVLQQRSRPLGNRHNVREHRPLDSRMGRSVRIERAWRRARGARLTAAYVARRGFGFTTVPIQKAARSMPRMQQSAEQEFHETGMGRPLFFSCTPRPIGTGELDRNDRRNTTPRRGWRHEGMAAGIAATAQAPAPARAVAGRGRTRQGR